MSLKRSFNFCSIQAITTRKAKKHNPLYRLLKQRKGDTETNIKSVIISKIRVINNFGIFYSALVAHLRLCCAIFNLSNRICNIREAECKSALGPILALDGPSRVPDCFHSSINFSYLTHSFLLSIKQFHHQYVVNKQQNKDLPIYDDEQ